MIGQDKIATVPDTEPMSARLRRIINSLVDRIASCRRTLYSSTTTAGNGAGVETDLFVFNMRADQLESAADTLAVFAAGSFAATASADKRVRFKIGAATVFDTGALAIVSSTAWTLSATITRTGKLSQKCVTEFTASGVLPLVQYATSTVDLSTDLVVKLTGQATLASDVVTQVFVLDIQRK